MDLPWLPKWLKSRKASLPEGAKEVPPLEQAKPKAEAPKRSAPKKNFSQYKPSGRPSGNSRDRRKNRRLSKKKNPPKKNPSEGK